MGVNVKQANDETETEQKEQVKLEDLSVRCWVGLTERGSLDSFVKPMPFSLLPNINNPILHHELHPLYYAEVFDRITVDGD